MHTHLKTFIILSALLMLCSNTFASDSQLSCTGFGLQRLKKENVELAKARISEKKLLAGEALSLDFLSVIGFEVEHNGENFVAYFTEEDVGVRKHTLKEFKSISDFKNFRSGTEIELVDDELKRSYWRIEVICGVGLP